MTGGLGSVDFIRADSVGSTFVVVIPFMERTSLMGSLVLWTSAKDNM